MKDIGDRPALYAGQLGRAQPHYTESDRPIMEKCWVEDAWPVLREKLKHRRVPLRPGDDLPRARQQAQHQPRIDDYFSQQRRQL